MDLFETYRDMAAGMMDVYLSCVSNRLNEVMRVLTVIAMIGGMLVYFKRKKRL